ncbi:Rgt1p LALA0_S02e01068g [Lachancea lanzarotensis]|uniref:LALA0S02e01068g1_1 n=1 Tax=Lachancea lanzarotensis TaxID=1245769 RepID=A0A0C7N605_9SACH|nr:uncharacterized protein LALA0_S02e01068g [Lachancea lanzarotensis]CEP60850.1 LALA0S02e01068g1_1 [Lachancea lanzarotensis]
MSELTKSASNSDSVTMESSAEEATTQSNVIATTNSRESPKEAVDENPGDKDVAPNGGVGIVTERRRSKASRACDQCREKKTKCDFGDGSHSAVCSVCKKLGKTCTFARVPMKRGPVKGYNRHSEDADSVDGGNWGARKRSCSESFPEDSARGKIDLPPLNQYLPSSSSSGPQQKVHGMLSVVQQQQQLQQQQQQQQQQPHRVHPQQFWKVPYHEYQYQRRESVDSLASDVSNRRGSDQFAYAASNASSASPFYPMPQPPQPAYAQLSNAPHIEADLQYSKATAHLPALQRTSSSKSNSSQYPYSQFNNALPQHSSQQPFMSNLAQPQQTQNSDHEQFREFNPAFHSRKNSNASEAVSPSSSVKMVPVKMSAPTSNVPEKSLGNNLNRERSNSEHASFQRVPDGYPDAVAHDRTNASLGRSGSSTNKRSGSQASMDSHSPMGRSIVVYGKIPDNQLVDIYYEFIHPTFPVIPINKHTLTNEVLVINTQPVSHIHELNCYVLQWFRNSLELLVRVALKKPSGSAYDYSDGIVDVFDSQTTFIAALNESFQKIVDIHPRLRENDGVLSQKIKFIYLATFTILNYVLAFVGYDNSFVLGMSVTIFNELKLFRYLTYDAMDVVERPDGQDPIVASEEKGYNALFKRLYSILVIFDSLQSCTFGVPKLMSVPLPDLISDTFAYSADKWSLEQDKSRVDIMQQSLRLGDVLSRLSTGRKSTCIGPGAIWPDLQIQDTTNEISTSHFAQLLIESHKLVTRCVDVLPALSEQHIVELCFAICQVVTTMQRVLTAIMRANPTNSIDPNNRPPSQQVGGGVYANEHDKPSNTTESDMYKKLLGLNGNASTSLSQGTVSPFVVSMVAYVSNLLELVKQLPSTLIALVVRRLTLQSDSQRVVLELSNCMSELVQITSLLSVLKPYKMFEQTPRAFRGSSLALARRLRDRYENKPEEEEQNRQDKDQDPETLSLSDTIWGLLSTLELGWL